MCTSSGGLFSFLKARPGPGAYAWILKWNKIKVGSLHTMSMWKLEFFSMLQGSVFKFMSIDWSGVRKRWYFGLKYLFLLTQTQLGSVSISRSCMLTKCWNTELNRRLLAEMLGTCWVYSQVAAADAGGPRAASGDVFWDSRALLLRIFELVLSFVLDREGWCYDCVLTGKTTLYSGDCAGG